MATTDTMTFRAGILTGEEPEAVYEVLEKRLARPAGKGALNSRSLRAWAVLDHLWVAEQEETIIGFLLTSPVSTLDVWEWNQKLGEEAIITPEPCLHLLDMVVAEEHRNSGIGTALVRGILEHEKYYNQGGKYPLAVATSRVPSSGNPRGTSYHCLEKNGFFEVGTIEGFYRNADRWTCPRCFNKEACDCLGVMMEWERREE